MEPIPISSDRETHIGRCEDLIDKMALAVTTLFTIEKYLMNIDGTKKSGFSELEKEQKAQQRFLDRKWQEYEELVKEQG